jgi:hypothetical protein
MVRQTIHEAMAVGRAHDAAAQNLKDRVHERLSEKSQLDPVTGCWIYTGYWDEHGNARIRVGERPYTVHRAAAWVYWDNFELDSEELIVHSCETPACWYPKHLVRCATRRDVLAYMRKRGRPCHRRLTQASADRMRVQAGTMNRTALAVANHVGCRAVGEILRGEAWAATA